MLSGAAMAGVDFFHFEMDMQIGIESEGLSLDVPVTFVGDVQAPDRVQGTLSMTLFGILTIEYQVINIGDTTYQTDSQTGEWEVTASPAVPFTDPSDFLASKPSDFLGLTLVGEETLDGVQVYHLSGTLLPEAFGGIQGDLEADIWTGVEDSLVRQVAVKGVLQIQGDGGLLPVGVGPGNVAVDMTVKFSDYGKPISIEAPQVGP